MYLGRTYKYLQITDNLKEHKEPRTRTHAEPWVITAARTPLPTHGAMTLKVFGSPPLFIEEPRLYSLTKGAPAPSNSEHSKTRGNTATHQRLLPTTEQKLQTHMEKLAQREKMKQRATAEAAAVREAEA